MPHVTRELPPGFPWKPKSKHNHVLWYCLITIEDGKLKHESHRSSGVGIEGLLVRLRAVQSRPDALLLAVWEGNFGNNLLEIDIAVAISRLEKTE
jgi:hypothetical protein